ncbi:MAG: hypothetical protein OEM98_07205 [Gammaproteobacteria bacterium]|nr:hypothetical protein [Gammaproteobacteria bacterium]
MNISENAQSTTKAVCALLGVQPDSEKSRQVSRIIERSIVSALLSEAERYTQVVMSCCSADMDMAHKLTAEIRSSTDALITNLSSMR